MNEPSEEVKEVERRYEATIDKMQQLVDRLKTERMSQAEFEQYAKEHGYIISTTNIIEQIRYEIKAEMDDIASGCIAKYSHDEGYYRGLRWALRIIDKYK